jgi:hypothetical protein
VTRDILGLSEAARQPKREGTYFVQNFSQHPCNEVVKWNVQADETKKVRCRLCPSWHFGRVTSMSLSDDLLIDFLERPCFGIFAGMIATE